MLIRLHFIGLVVHHPDVWVLRRKKNFQLVYLQLCCYFIHLDFFVLLIFFFFFPPLTPKMPFIRELCGR